MFDTLPETKGRAAVLGSFSISTSLLVHGGALVALVALSLLWRVSPGPDAPSLPMEGVTVILPPPLGNSLQAGGGNRPRPREIKKPPAPPERREAFQPVAPPSRDEPLPPRSPAAEAERSSPETPAGTATDGDASSGEGGHGEGSGEGPGTGPGRYGVPNGTERGAGDPGQADQPEGILYVGGNVESPVLLRRVEPVYPPLPLRAGIQGTVVLEGVIGTSGRVESIRVVQSVPMLNDAAIRAVTQWLYAPGRMGGRAVKVYLTIRVDFRLH
jgi:protein TonB